MQRRATKQSRAANVDEKKYHQWLKEREICSACGKHGPVILHHCKGSSFKHNKVLIGHWFVLGLCQQCDDLVTHGSIRRLEESARLSQSQMWNLDRFGCPDRVSPEVDFSIWDYGVGREQS